MRNVLAVIGSSLLALSLVACASTTPPTGAAREALLEDAERSVAAFKERDPDIERFFNTSHAYAIFPSIAKGAAGIGGANGRGVVYEQGVPVGYTTISQATIGLQLGGQSYSELIFFRTASDLDRFQKGNLEFDAQASAVAADKGASAKADYSKGVAVFTMTRGGLMYEASLGGQQFTYAPFDGPENGEADGE